MESVRKKFPFTRTLNHLIESCPVEDKLALIWDRYYKIDSAHKRAAQGTGLGLSIVNRIMTLLGGKCGVESRVGVGSTFFIEIPAEK